LNFLDAREVSSQTNPRLIVGLSGVNRWTYRAKGTGSRQSIPVASAPRNLRSSHVSHRKVVVTGIGITTSLGMDVETCFSNLLAGRSGISAIEAFDTSAYPTRIAAEIKGWDPSVAMDPKEARRNDRYTQFAVAAAKGALADARLDLSLVNKDRMGVLIGSGIGGLSTLEEQARVLIEKGPRRVSPFLIPALIANMAGGIVAILTGARGPNFAVVSACSTSTHALGEAALMIRQGRADIILAGGSEAPITPLGFAGFCSMKAMSTRNDEPTRASRPFDRARDGFVMGEGAAVLVLESHEHATARGARIYAEFTGYGASDDAHHITMPDPGGAGLALAMSTALQDAAIEPSAVDYINAHGTSTPYNDKFETLAIKQVFQEHANRVAISSTKSMTGHLLGAAGSLEAAVCCKVIQTGQIPPTINLDTPDRPDCDLDYVPNVKREMPVRIALTNNLGFGGHNATLIFQAPS
jgi:3-oxoacyl-[acyl-carrier-protein] synthase II